MQIISIPQHVTKINEGIIGGIGRLSLGNVWVSLRLCRCWPSELCADYQAPASTTNNMACLTIDSPQVLATLFGNHSAILRRRRVDMDPARVCMELFSQAISSWELR